MSQTINLQDSESRLCSVSFSVFYFDGGFTSCLKLSLHLNLWNLCIFYFSVTDKELICVCVHDLLWFCVYSLLTEPVCPADVSVLGSGRAGPGLGVSQPLSLSLWSSASLCQLQRCPTFTCLPSLHLTACLKKINISAGEEKRRLPSEVFICAGRRRREQRERPVRETPGFWISSSSFSSVNQCSRLKQQPARQRSDQRGSRGQWYDWTKL